MIISDTVSLPKTDSLNVQDIEKIISDDYGEIIRWAIVNTDESNVKISFSYKKRNN